VLNPIQLIVFSWNIDFITILQTICIICKQTLTDSPASPALANACQHARKPTIDHRPAQSPSVPAETPPATVLQPPPLLSNLQTLLEQYIQLCNLLQTIVCTEEQETQQSMQFELLGVQSYSYPYYFPAHVLLELHTNLWYQLAYPLICKVRLLTYELAVQLERIFHLHFPELSRIKFHAPRLIQTPSLQS